jgi:hypothetical protein
MGVFSFDQLSREDLLLLVRWLYQIYPIAFNNRFILEEAPKEVQALILSLHLDD